jgi:hypothetical protein
MTGSYEVTLEVPSIESLKRGRATTLYQMSLVVVEFEDEEEDGCRCKALVVVELFITEMFSWAALPTDWFEYDAVR